MTRSIITTLSLLLLTIAIALAWQYKTNIKLSKDLATTQKTANDQQALIAELKIQKHKLNSAQRALAKDLQKNKAAVLHQISQLKALEHENKQYHDWADNLLPAAIISLQQRPSITGNQHYRQYLRDRSTLPTQPNKTDQQ